MQDGHHMHHYHLHHQGHGIDFYVLGFQISGIGTLIGGINFLVTIINMRAPGMTYMRMPMFTWTTFVTSALNFICFSSTNSWISFNDV